MRMFNTHKSITMSHKASTRRRFRGSAVLEAALTLPVVLFLTFGCIEYGYFFYVKNTVQGAAREGARAAITPTSVNADATTAISNTMTAAGLQSSGYTTKVESPLGTAATVSSLSSGTAIYVTVECTWGTVGLRPMGLIGAAKKVTGTAVMRKE